MASRDGQFEIKTCPMLGSFNTQRFKQWSPEDQANWYIVKDENTKTPIAMYPTMGRSHISYNGENQLIFSAESRGLFKTIKYAYIVVGNSVYRVDNSYNLVVLPGMQSLSGKVYFAMLVVNTIIFACFVDDQYIYIYQEEGIAQLIPVTDLLAPGANIGQLGKVGYIASFGNRLIVSIKDSSQFALSAINLQGNGAAVIPGQNFDPAKCFTNYTTPSVTATEDGIIRQLGVLNNTLYIFTDYVTGVWSNISASFTGNNPAINFPWKKNTTYNWNFGIANPNSLNIDFGYMIWLAKNSNGLLQFMMSNGGQPERISTKAVDTLLQRYTDLYGANNPFLVQNSNGFIFQYENTIFYRMSGGNYYNNGILDQEQNANCIEFNLEAQKWHRCIEQNGERNRIQYHVYFNFKHLASVTDDYTIYEMSGQYYTNELRNPAQEDDQEEDAYIAYPMRYERVSPIIFEPDYSEFETEFVQIDFVWGESNINYSTAPFSTTKFLIAEQPDSSGRTQYIIAEQPDAQGNPIFMIAEGNGYPAIGELTYNTLLKPSIELFYSDDGGISFDSADTREFSQSGVYSWRMRWYQLGTSRNRCYKLIAVSPVPIVILGATMNVRKMNDGSY